MVDKRRESIWTADEFRELHDHLHEGVAIDGTFFGESFPEIAGQPSDRGYRPGYINVKPYVSMVIDALEIAAGMAKVRDPNAGS